MLVPEEAVGIRVLRRQGKSIGEIARMLDVSRNTVQRYLRSEGLATLLWALQAARFLTPTHTFIGTLITDEKRKEIAPRSLQVRASVMPCSVPNGRHRSPLVQLRGAAALRSNRPDEYLGGNPEALVEPADHLKR